MLVAVVGGVYKKSAPKVRKRVALALAFPNLDLVFISPYPQFSLILSLLLSPIPTLYLPYLSYPSHISLILFPLIPL